MTTINKIATHYRKLYDDKYDMISHQRLMINFMYVKNILFLYLNKYRPLYWLFIDKFRVCVWCNCE